MFHLTDGMSTYSLTMAAGTHVFMPRFDPRQCLELIERHAVTHICLVPTMIEMLVNLAEKERFDCSSLRQIQFGAAPMPEATLARAIRLWPDLLFLHGWGMTELSPLGMLMPFEWRDPKTAGDRMRSCGMPVWNEEARIVDADGNECPAGVVGELVVRGPMVMKEYWNLPEETEKALRDGWMHTGDAAYVDEEGFFYIVDRIKDMIITGGENVYSLEVENVIGQMAGVQAGRRHRRARRVLGRDRPRGGGSRRRRRSRPRGRGGFLQGSASRATRAPARWSSAMPCRSRVPARFPKSNCARSSSRRATDKRANRRRPREHRAAEA